MPRADARPTLPFVNARRTGVIVFGFDSVMDHRPAILIVDNEPAL